MADALIGFLTEAVLTKAVSLAADELSLSFGVKKQLKKLVEKMELVQALLSDAQSKQLTSKVVQLWLKKVKSVALDAQIVLDDFGYEVLRKKIECRKRDKVRSLFSSSNPVLYHSIMGHRIKNVLLSLERVFVESNRIGLHAIELINTLPDLSETNRLTDPFVEDSDILGRDDDVWKVMNMLTGCDDSRDLSFIAILGMGGLGKTTLAQLLYKSVNVDSYFEKKVWVCVSDDFNVERLLARIWESLTQTNCQLSGREALVNRLKEQLRAKRYLLVLDDVWNENRHEWDVMRRCLLAIGGSKGSKVMSTTRSEEVALAMRACRRHQLQKISEEQSLALFEKCAFAESGANKTPELVAVAKRILKRCGGVPLAIKAIGGLLFSKTCESEWLMIEKSELWSTIPSIGGSGVLSAIRLSYDHLPSLSLKQCFAYCAIFQKDTKLEKDKLIQLWIAQGFLNPPKGCNLQMEDLGDIYFNILLKSSLLQDAAQDHFNKYTCKMHDLVHDFSLQVSESYCIDMKDWKVGSKQLEAVHLSVINCEKGLWKSLKGTVSSKLRTIQSDYGLEDWFTSFRCLTVLTIEDGRASALPNSIGKITHLRYLDISGTCISRLPKSFTELYYFQTLRIRYLDELPDGFGNLINLRHLYLEYYTFGFNEPTCLIPGLGRLTDLKTLPFFKVDKSKGCQLEQLEHLDNLKGELRIFCLQNVSSYKSALSSNLSKKSNIQYLKLHWDERGHDCDDTDVMEGLKPHSNLKILKIDGYQSPKLPSWMIANNNIMLLRNLVKFSLEGLGKCERLPSFGDLPRLEYLKIGPLPKVKSIMKEFYGWSNLDGAEMIVFPALKLLEVCHMDSLEEWSDAAVIPTHPSTKVFPSLEVLRLYGLPSLSVFPNLGSLPRLQRLFMSRCQNLTLPSGWNSLMSHEVEADAVAERCCSCPDFDINPDIHFLPSLRELSIWQCDKFVAPFCSLEKFTALKSLSILGSPSLWPKDIRDLINLESLEIGSYSAEITNFPWPYNARRSDFLISLRLFGWPKVTDLPDEIQYLTMLRELEICDFEGLESLPEWLGNLPSPFGR